MMQTAWRTPCRSALRPAPPPLEPPFAISRLLSPGTCSTFWLFRRHETGFFTKGVRGVYGVGTVPVPGTCLSHRDENRSEQACPTRNWASEVPQTLYNANAHLRDFPRQ